jgi:hypothetical protein
MLGCMIIGHYSLRGMEEQEYKLPEYELPEREPEMGIPGEVTVQLRYAEYKQDANRGVFLSNVELGLPDKIKVWVPMPEEYAWYEGPEKLTDVKLKQLYNPLVKKLKKEGIMPDPIASLVFYHLLPGRRPEYLGEKGEAIQPESGKKVLPRQGFKPSNYMDVLFPLTDVANGELYAVLFVSGI